MAKKRYTAIDQDRRKYILVYRTQANEKKIPEAATPEIRAVNTSNIEHFCSIVLWPNRVSNTDGASPMCTLLSTRFATAVPSLYLPQYSLSTVDVSVTFWSLLLSNNKALNY